MPALSGRIFLKKPLEKLKKNNFNFIRKDMDNVPMIEIKKMKPIASLFSARRNESVKNLNQINRQHIVSYPEISRNKLGGWDSERVSIY